MDSQQDAQIGEGGWEGITRAEERCIWISHIMAQTQANACNALLAVNWGLFYLLSMDTASHGALPHGACDSPQEAHDSSTTGTSGEDQGPLGANSHEYPGCGEDQGPLGANSHEYP